MVASTLTHLLVMGCSCAMVGIEGAKNAKTETIQSIGQPAAFPGVKYPQTSREPVMVPPDQVEIDEASLPPDLQSTEGTRAETLEQVGRSWVKNSRTQELGLRIFAFTLAPGETLKATLRSGAGNAIWMTFLKPASEGGVAEKLKSMAKVQARLKSSNLEFTNPLLEPFTLFLRVSGPTQTDYRLSIARVEKR